MIELLYDTETTGFPSKKPWADPSQPHLIQIAALVMKNGEFLHGMNTIINCPIEVPEGAFKVHGISRERSMKEGKPLSLVLQSFNGLVKICDRMIAFNQEFDLKMLRIGYERAGIDPVDLLEAERYCAMRTAAKKMGFHRRVSLDKAYRHFVNAEGFDGAHNAMADTKALYCVWSELRVRSAVLIA